ncbi:hypothetical protein B0H12DRAFT_1137106 [Mycena haematopus]|nr:hypothetical protein B0H12DRAFT_1137106 [Mycena haematopus]
MTLIFLAFAPLGSALFLPLQVQSHCGTLANLLDVFLWRSEYSSSIYPIQLLSISSNLAASRLHLVVFRVHTKIQRQRWCRMLSSALVLSLSLRLLAWAQDGSTSGATSSDGSLLLRQRDITHSPPAADWYVAGKEIVDHDGAPGRRDQRQSHRAQRIPLKSVISFCAPCSVPRSGASVSCFVLSGSHLGTPLETCHGLCTLLEDSPTPRCTSLVSNQDSCRTLCTTTSSGSLVE